MKAKRILLIILLLSILAVSAWICWEREFSLMTVLPDEDWKRAEIWVGDPGVGDSLQEGTVDLDAVLAALEQAQVNRGPEFRSMSQPYFKLVLYKGEAYPTYITVVENGKIAVAAELDFDHYRYYEGGEMLYAALCNLISDMS